ncbi:MAG: hypothetical protein PHO20_01415 [Candidatus Peribacteraceae bacterium]|nr:hypothetical protein [Candidatus Peribacteraceae bacterium]
MVQITSSGDTAVEHEPFGRGLTEVSTAVNPAQQERPETQGFCLLRVQSSTGKHMHWSVHWSFEVGHRHPLGADRSHISPESSRPLPQSVMFAQEQP